MVRKNILNLAINQAKKVILGDRKSGKYRLGAVLFSNNNILSVGNNKFSKTHPLSLTPYKSICAEFDAILGVPRNELEGSNICVVRINQKNELTMARPCAHCQRLLKQSGIKKVYWSDFSGAINVTRV